MHAIMYWRVLALEPPDRREKLLLDSSSPCHFSLFCSKFALIFASSVLAGKLFGDCRLQEEIQIYLQILLLVCCLT